IDIDTSRIAISGAKQCAGSYSTQQAATTVGHKRRANIATTQQSATGHTSEGRIRARTLIVARPLFPDPSHVETNPDRHRHQARAPPSSTDHATVIASAQAAWPPQNPSAPPKTRDPSGRHGS